MRRADKHVVGRQVIHVPDKYGEEPVPAYWQGNTVRVMREGRTPVLALNTELASLVGQRIKAARLAKGMSLRELCLAAGLATTTPKQRMWEIENNIRGQGVTLGTLYALAIALGVDVTSLLPTMAEAREFAVIEERVNPQVTARRAWQRAG